MYNVAEAVTVADLYFDVWIDPRLQVLTWFGSTDMKWGWRFENVVESWDANGNVRLFRKLLHLWFNLVSKRGPVDAIAVLLGLPWDDWLVSDSVVDDDGHWQMVWTASRFCYWPWCFAWPVATTKWQVGCAVVLGNLTGVNSTAII